MTFRKKKKKTRKSAANLGTSPRPQSPLVDLCVVFPRLSPLKRPMGCVNVRHPENSRPLSCCLLYLTDAVFSGKELSLVTSVSSFEMLVEEVWLAYL